MRDEYDPWFIPQGAPDELAEWIRKQNAGIGTSQDPPFSLDFARAWLGTGPALAGDIAAAPANAYSGEGQGASTRPPPAGPQDPPDTGLGNLNIGNPNPLAISKPKLDDVLKEQFRRYEDKFRAEHGVSPFQQEFSMDKFRTEMDKSGTDPEATRTWKDIAKYHNVNYELGGGGTDAAADGAAANIFDVGHGRQGDLPAIVDPTLKRALEDRAKAAELNIDWNKTIMGRRFNQAYEIEPAEQAENTARVLTKLNDEYGEKNGYPLWGGPFQQGSGIRDPNGVEPASASTGTERAPLPDGGKPFDGPKFVKDTFPGDMIHFKERIAETIAKEQAVDIETARKIARLIELNKLGNEVSKGADYALAVGMIKNGQAAAGYSRLAYLMVQDYLFGKMFHHTKVGRQMETVAEWAAEDASEGTRRFLGQ